MKPVAIAFLLLSVVTLGPAAQTTVTLESAVGKWHSTERFEDESRISVAIQQKDRSLVGWAVLLGQHRKKTIARRWRCRSMT